jgi:hypothetical protein
LLIDRVCIQVFPFGEDLDGAGCFFLLIFILGEIHGADIIARNVWHGHTASYVWYEAEGLPYDIYGQKLLCGQTSGPG